METKFKAIFGTAHSRWKGFGYIIVKCCNTISTYSVISLQTSSRHCDKKNTLLVFRVSKQALLRWVSLASMSSSSSVNSLIQSVWEWNISCCHCRHHEQKWKCDQINLPRFSTRKQIDAQWLPFVHHVDNSKDLIMNDLDWWDWKNVIPVLKAATGTASKTHKMRT